MKKAFVLGLTIFSANSFASDTSEIADLSDLIASAKSSCIRDGGEEKKKACDQFDQLLKTLKGEMYDAAKKIDAAIVPSAN